MFSCLIHKRKIALCNVNNQTFEHSGKTHKDSDYTIVITVVIFFNLFHPYTCTHTPAGAEGNVDESLTVMKEVEEIKAKKKSLEDEYHSAIPRHTVQQQKLRACEVCGAFLSMYDNDRRLADHFGGKLHIGFVTIREKIKYLEVS